VSFFDKNIELLCFKYPDFKNDVLEKFQDKCSMAVTLSKSGLPTATIDGKFIHSNRGPVREAERLVNVEIPKDISACIVEGFGLGYYVEAILLLRPHIPIIIVEPSGERFIKALEVRDLSIILTSQRISILIGSESESIR